MPGLHLRSLIAGGIMLATLVGCRSSLERRFEFEPVETQVAGGDTIAIVVRGKGITSDRAGAPAEGDRGPYWVAVYVRGGSMSSTRIRSIQFLGLESGILTSPQVPAPAAAGDGKSHYVQFKALDLSFENHRVTIHLDQGSGGQTRADSIQLFLGTHVEEHRLSVWDWLGGL